MGGEIREGRLEDLTSEERTEQTPENIRTTTHPTIIRLNISNQVGIIGYVSFGR